MEDTIKRRDINIPWKGIAKTLGQAEYETSYITFGDTVVICEIYGLHLGLKPIVDFMCPRCGGQLRIDGNKKTIHVEKTTPAYYRMPNGESMWVTNRITIDEPITCPYERGKGICGWRARITDGKASLA